MNRETFPNRALQQQILQKSWLSLLMIVQIAHFCASKIREIPPIGRICRYDDEDIRRISEGRVV